MRPTLLHLTAVLLLAPRSPSADTGHNREDTEAVRALVTRGRHAEALEKIDPLLTLTAGDHPPDSRRLELLELKSTCLFELDDFRACESTLALLLDEAPRDGEFWLRALGRLALIQESQGAHDDAIVTLTRFLSQRESLPHRRAIVRCCLKSRRYADALPHLNQIIRQDPGDTLSRVYRGVVLSKTGDSPVALQELKHGLEASEAATRREARFETALVLSRLGRPRDALTHLLDIVTDDPFDGDACYQISRQLLNVGGRSAVTASAQVLQYFRLLRDAEGPATHDRHYELSGRGVDAALERAQRWERLQDYGRTLGELQSQLARRDNPRLRLELAGFWVRRGLLAEAAREIQAARRYAPSDGDPTATVLSRTSAALEDRVALARREVEGTTDPRLKAALEEAASCRWESAREPLEVLLRVTIATRDTVRADVTARLLLARHAESIAALRHLAARTMSPSLRVPHLHYLARLESLEPDRREWRQRLLEARKGLSGE